jgi:hypothetical protein
MSGYEGIVWTDFAVPMAGGGSAKSAKSGGSATPDYARFGARLQRDVNLTAAGTVIPVYEMPGDLLRAPSSIELQLFEPPLFLPEAPITPARLSSPFGRLHARIFYSVGNTGLIRVDCDWHGSVPIVAHKSLSVAVVADRFYAGPDGPSLWESDYTFVASTAPGDPGAHGFSFNAALPDVGDPITAPPTIAYVSRDSVSAEDIRDFTATQTNQTMRLTVEWGAGAELRFRVASIVEHATYIEFVLSGLTTIGTTMPEALADDSAIAARVSWEDSPSATRIDVAVGLLVGSPPSASPPSYTFAATPIAASSTAAFPVPAFARKLRCSFKWGDTPGSIADAPLGQWFVSFMTRGFDALSWIDGASAREALFGDGVFVPPGTQWIVIDNRAADPITVTPSFVLGL